MKTLVIVNPASGGGAGAKRYEQIRKEFEKLKFKYDLELTTIKRHGGVIAAQKGEKYDYIICVGGDGSLNEIVNGVMKLKKKPGIAVILGGTGNAYATTLKMPKDIRTIARKVIKPKFKKVDLIRIVRPKLYAIGFVGFGLDAEVLSMRNWMGISGLKGYIIPFFWMLFKHVKYRFKIYMNGKRYRKRLMQLIISKSPYYGGALHLSPNACIDDGFLDITTFSLSRLDLIRHCKGILWGALKHKKIRYYKTEAVKIRVRRRTPCQYDGKMLNAKQRVYRLKVVPEAIKIATFE